MSNLRQGITTIDRSKTTAFKRISTMSVLMILLSYGPAFALDMEFYTYGGFDIVLDAWKAIALVFGDNNYKALFFSVIALSIFLGGATSYFKLLMGAKGSSLAWVWPISLGVLLYLGLVLPKGTITVYDPVQNKFEQVSNIPDGLVAVAGMLNRVEYGIVEILNTAGSVQEYQNSAGGFGFTALLGVTGQQLPIGDEYLMMSLDKYQEKCVLFEMNSPNARISYEEVKNQSADFVPIWERASNPAIYTTYYDDANRGGITATCRDAWLGNGSIAGVKAQILDPASLEKGFKSVCGGIGFNPDDALQYQRCKDLIGNYADWIHNGTAVNAQNFVRQSAIAKSLEYTLTRLNPDLATAAQIARNSMTSGIGMGIAANEWMPVTRAVFTAIFLGMIPVLALLIPTGFAARTIGYMAGFFVWLTLWGISDAIVHIAASNLSYKVMEGVRQSNLGYTSIMLWPSFGQKALAQFGMMRSIGMFTASAIAVAIFKFGGHAMVAMAGSAVHNIQSMGAQAAHVAGTPEGTASALESWRGSIPTMANVYKNDFERSVSANTALKVGEQAGRINAMAHMGGPGGYESAIAHREGINQITGLSHAGQLNMTDAARIGAVGGISQKQQAWNNTAQTMVDMGYARDLNQAHEIMSQIQARGGFMGLQSTAGQWDAAGGDPDKFYQLAAQRSGIDIGGMEQTQLGMNHFGMNAKEWGAFEKTHILDEGMAVQLRKDGFSFAQAGMNANIGFDRTGRPAFMTGRMETGSYGATYDGGMLRTSFTKDGFVMHQTRDKAGNILLTEASRGSVFQTRDIKNTQIERLATNLSGFRGESGSRNTVYDVDEKQISHGTIYNTATMFTAATTNRGSDSIAERILSFEGKMREREITSAAAQWASAVGSLATRRGFNADSSQASVGAGIGPYHGIGANGSVGIQSTDQKEQNLMASQFSSTVHNAIDEARAKGFDTTRTRAHVSGAIQALSAKVQTDMNTATTKHYGSTAAVKAAGDAVQSIPISTDFEPPIN